jgi:feruloyl esterase
MEREALAEREEIVMELFRAACFAVMVAIVGHVTAFSAGKSCEELASLALPEAKISLAQPVTTGTFEKLTNLPPFCRVAATLTPTSDSDIKVEVWLPASGWNGKFLAVGNGAWSGSISYPAMAEALRRGYATSSTDTGHVGNTAEFAFGHPEKLVDFGHRSVHEMTVKAKAIVAAHYGDSPKYSYWSGCSAGGRQAMKEAQKYPADFDGIIAGSPGLDWTGRAAAAMRIAQVTKNEDARVTPAKARMLHAAVIEACDAIDGLEDGLIDDPRKCTFDPGVLECKGADGPECLTKAQVQTARMMRPSSRPSIASHASMTAA